MNPRYEIRESIGQGGLGSVHKAFDTQLQREVAVKRVLTAEHGSDEEIQSAGQKLISEAQTLSSLNHPNIITVFDVGQDDQGGFVVMELLKGETLDETVERGVLTTEDFVEVVYQTMEGLIAAQDKNVIHRDIKPTNIMLIWQASGKFQLKILDFGLAKFSKNPSVQTMDQEDAVMGSIFFMAPEQFERAELDARTDLYQMGCVYYNALTGQYPFNGETAPQVMNAHLQHKVVPLEQLRPDMPPAMAQWVMWLINRDIDSRPANAKEAIQYFPRDAQTEDIPTAVIVEPASRVTTRNVRIVTPGANASAPPNLIVTGGATTGRLATGTGNQTVVQGTTGRLVTGNHTTAQRTTSARRSTAEKPKPKKGFQNPKVIGGTIAGVIALVILLTFILKGQTSRKNAARLAAITEATDPQGSSRDVDILHGFLTGSNATMEQRNQAYNGLIKLEGSDVDSAILVFLKQAKGELPRRQLATILAKREYPPALDTILQYAGSARSDKEKVQFVNSAASLAGPKHFDSFLEGLGKTDDRSVRRAYEEALLAIIRADGNSASLQNRLRKRAEETSDAERRSLFRVLGVLGGQPTRAMIDKILAGQDVSLKQDALSAYRSWPNRSPMPVVAGIAQAKNGTLAIVAQSAYSSLLEKPGPQGIGKLITDWQKGYELFQNNPSEMQQMMQGTIKYPHPRTLGMVEAWKSHDKYGTLAEAVSKAITKEIAKVPTLESGGTLQASQAKLEGSRGGAELNSSAGSISRWNSIETFFNWVFKVRESGDYRITVRQADTNLQPSEFFIYAAGKKLTGFSTETPDYESFEPVRLDGSVTLQQGEIYRLSLVAGMKTEPRMMDIQSIVLNKQ